ncbi:MAG: DUF721 domain-containing protein [Bacteroidetes bacterium]|nr:MAG: DUF721 domain-containing protein [Bacteroidota bacterium]TAG85508.1 MAG: DUF721 domain-containing protein [Bacteroidota bacterium]
MNDYQFEWENKNKLYQQETNSIKNVLSGMVNTLKFKEKFGEISIFEAWEKTLGENVLRRTEKLQIKDRKIYVKIESAALKNELLMNKTTILFNLNQFAGEDLVDDIILL